MLLKLFSLYTCEALVISKQQFVQGFWLWVGFCRDPDHMENTVVVT